MDGLQEHDIPSRRPERGGLARWLWSLAAALPLVGALAWLGAALVARRPGLAGVALLNVAAPLLGTAITMIVVEFFLGRGLLSANAAKWSFSAELDLEILLLGLVGLAQAASCGWCAWRAWPTLHSREPARPRLRRMSIALLLWLMLGWLGMHRFYCGRWLSGAAYAMSLGFCGIGWAFDLFYLDVLTSTVGVAPVANDSTRRLAPWAREVRHGWGEFLLRLGYFCLAPLVFVQLCVYFGRWEMLAVLIIVVVACGLLGDLDRVMTHLHHLDRIPLTRPAVFFLRDLYAYYNEHRPRPFVLYLFQPVLSPLLVWFSPDLRREMWLYGKFLLTVLALLAIQQFRDISVTYRYMSLDQIAKWILFHCAFAALMTCQFLVPIITSSFAMNLSGQQQRLKVLSFIVLGLTLPLGAMTYYYVNHLRQPTMISWSMLHSRLGNSRFREDMRTATELFLKHYQTATPPPTAPDREALHQELTERYRLHMASLLPWNEATALHVVTYSEHTTPGEVWLAVVLAWTEERQHDGRTLFLLTPNSRLLADWDATSPALRARFDRIAALEQLGIENRIADRSAELDARLYKESSRWLRAAADELAHAQVEQIHEIQFEQALTLRYRQLLTELAISDAEAFRVFRLPGDEVWLGVRDQRHALITASSDGDSVSRWDRQLFDPESESIRRLEMLQQYATPPPPGQRVSDPELAMDLLRQFSREFLELAAGVRWDELGGGWGTHAALTGELRDALSSLMPQRQRVRIEVCVWPDSNDPDLPWFGVRYDGQGLYILDAARAFYEHRLDNSQTARDAFAALNQLAVPTDQQAALPDQPAHR